jgi:hypothetical protein
LSGAEHCHMLECSRRKALKKTARVTRAVLCYFYRNEECDLPYFFIYTGSSLCSLTDRILHKYIPLAMCSTGTTNW